MSVQITFKLIALEKADQRMNISLDSSRVFQVINLKLWCR